MEVADFDTTARRTIAAGGKSASAKFAVPGVCWQGYFLDPGGNTSGMCQPDSNAK